VIKNKKKIKPGILHARKFELCGIQMGGKLSLRVLTLLHVQCSIRAKTLVKIEEIRVISSKHSDIDEERYFL